VAMSNVTKARLRIIVMSGESGLEAVACKMVLSSAFRVLGSR
jgi:hypothetical protein